MKPIVHEACQKDEVIGEKVQKCPRKVLKKELEVLGINTRGKVISELQEIGEERNIPITTVEKIYIQEGRLGKSKGIWKIIFEHCLLDPTKTYVAKTNNSDPHKKPSAYSCRL